MRYSLPGFINYFTSEDLRNFFYFFALHLILGGKLDVCRRNDFFLFSSSFDFGRKIGIVFVSVDSCGVRINKLLNLGRRGPRLEKG